MEKDLEDLWNDLMWNDSEIAILTTVRDQKERELAVANAKIHQRQKGLLQKAKRSLNISGRTALDDLAEEL